MQEQSSSFETVLLSHFSLDSVPKETVILQRQISSSEVREAKLTEIYSCLERELSACQENKAYQSCIQIHWISYLFVLMADCRAKWEEKHYQELLKELRKYWKMLQKVMTNPKISQKQPSPFLGKLCQFFEQAPLPEPKPTKTNLCTAMIKPEQTYYCCSTCISSSSLVQQTRFCKKCWKQQLHRYHNFYENQHSYSEPINCLCGREEKMKKEGFCSDHVSETISVKISPEDMNFVGEYSVYCNLWLMLKQNIIRGRQEDSAFQIMEKRCRKTLEKLVLGSAYYSTLFIRLIDEPCVTSQQNVTLFYALIEKQVWDSTFAGALGTTENQLALAQKFYSLKNKEKIEKLPILKKRIYEGEQILFQLAKQKIYIHECLKQYLALAAKSQFGKNLLHQFLQQLTKLEDAQYFPFLQHFILDRDHPMFPLNEESLISVLRKVFSHIQKQKEKIVNNGSFDQKYRNAMFLGIKTVCSLAKGRSQIAQNMLQFLKQKGFETSSIFNFIELTIKIIKQVLLIRDKLITAGFVIILLMLEKSQAKEDYLEKIWTEITKKDHSIENIIEMIYVIVCKVSNFPSAQSQISLAAETDPQKILENEAKLQRNFCSFLYQKKTTSTHEIWRLKREKALCFKNAADILNRLCTFDDENEKYEYCSDQEYPSPLVVKFPLPSLFNRLRRLMQKMKDVSVSQNLNLSQNMLQKKLFQFLFTTKVFKLHFFDYWKNQISPQKKKQVGMYYILVIIIVSQVCQHKIEWISDELKILREEGQEKYETTGYEDKISKMLEIDKEGQNKEDKPSRSPAKKIKKRAQKKPIQQEEKKEQFGQKEELRDFEKKCIICKEIEEDKGQFSYVAHIVKENTFSSIIHGAQNISKTLITTCFHTIHIECFKKTDYEKGKYHCPQCNKECNFILPTKRTQQSKHQLKICSNILITALILEFKYFSFENIFTLLIKHLIQSKGLYNLLNKDEEKRQKIKQINKYAIEMVSELYQKSYGEERAEYDQFGQSFLDEIRSCKPMFSDLQEVLFKTLWSKIKKCQIQIDFKLLHFLRENVDDSDFEAIKNELQIIKGNEIVTEQMKTPQIVKSYHNFSLKPIQLPSISQKLLDFLDKRCRCEKTFLYRLCLLCGQVECEECYNKSNHNEKQHKKSEFSLYLREGEIRMNKKRRNNITIPIYRNEFWLPYGRRGQSEEGEVFSLKQKCVEKAYKKFIEMYQ